jgi:hypothetical protein
MQFRNHSSVCHPSARVGPDVLSGASRVVVSPEPSPDELTAIVVALQSTKVEDESANSGAWKRAMRESILDTAIRSD